MNGSSELNELEQFAAEMEAAARWYKQHKGKPRFVTADEIEEINFNLAGFHA